MTEFSTIACNLFSLCSGCELQNNVLAPPIYQEMKAYFQGLGLDFPLFHKEITGWRTRAKLAIRGSAASPQIGLFKRGTHDVLPLLNCPLHHPAINKAVGALNQEMQELGIQPYDEKRLTGDLRYAQFVVERRTNRVQLTLVANAKKVGPRLNQLLQKLSESPLFHSLWVNFQTGSTNTILGAEWLHFSGEEILWENLGGNEISFHPACFSQAHLSLFDQMLSSLQKMMLPHKRVVEFYSGVGVIGLALAAQSQSVLCSEINPFSHSCFQKSKEKLPEELQKKVSFQTGNAASLAALAEEADVLVVDPPRKGLDASLRQAMTASSAQQILYISCGFASFQRDAADFLQSGWKLEKAEGYLLFPGSDHVEIIASFIPKKLPLPE